MKIKCTRCKRLTEDKIKWATSKGLVGYGCDYQYPYCRDCEPRNFEAEEIEWQERTLAAIYGGKQA